EVSRKQAIQNWPALLRRIATARAVEQLRQRVGTRARLCDSAEENGVELQMDHKILSPDDAAQASELADRLRVALGEIDAKQSQVFCLACLEECSYAEIAEQLNVTVSHVGVLLNRAKVALRERLKVYEPKLDRDAQKSGVPS